MTICVTNCFHWVGFHLVNRLIENDYAVDGIANLSTKKEEELYLMVGRNSNFSLFNNVSEIKDNVYTDAILINPEEPIYFQTSRTFTVGVDLGNPDFVALHTPLLFGEWMPMDEEGIFVNDQYIAFDSNEFQNEAIHINDFIDCFMQWLNACSMPNLIALTPNQSVIGEEGDPGKYIYLRKERPLEEQVNLLVNHYEKVKNN
ncbi:hypothetical protein [Virgibacillus sp. DJP39]|uniref:hypothetical protein n=1 Tax=Virgibacillus sp. DJP39 TaxID=3409790 RepID=UPI003BB5DB0D